MEFKEKVVLVTGSAQGIGKAAAVAFAKEGAHIVLNDINEERLKEAAGEVEKLGAECLVVPANTSVLTEVQEMFKQIADKFGHLDVLVNNAGITRDSFLQRMSEEQWKLVIDVNLTGVFFCLQAASKIMRKEQGGRIINISSDARFGNPGQANYSATKAGVVGLTKTAAKELARKNILVNAISPGAIDTDMIATVPPKTMEMMKSAIPLGRIGTTDDICNLILFFASEKSSYLTGQVMNCDGGMFMTG